jgi:hypothetical protein
MVYMCLAGIRGDAWVRFVRSDGSADIGCDVGCNDLHELTRIEVVDLADIRRGTCAAITVAGRPDDPRTVTMPCRSSGLNG